MKYIMKKEDRLYWVAVGKNKYRLRTWDLFNQKELDILLCLEKITKLEKVNHTIISQFINPYLYA